MYTHKLLEKYLLENVNGKDLKLVDYNLNGSLIKLKYSEECEYSSGETYRNYNELEIELLDYITWIYNMIQ